MNVVERGTLYIISGPIGNLGDITLRALEILKTVNLILSEDTRETDKLLSHYQIKKAQISYRDQNHDSIFYQVLNELNNGNNLALVSDSGTPLISDPGYKLVRDLVKENVSVVTIPGPSALIAALSVSGLPTDKFVFLGFLAKTDADRKKTLAAYANIDATLTIYESPFRLKRLLAEIQETLGARKLCVCNDLTKFHERIWRGTTSELIDQFETISPKGEFVVLIAREDF